MLILVLLGVYFDAVAVFVTSQTLLSRFALLCEIKGTENYENSFMCVENYQSDHLLVEN